MLNGHSPAEAEVMVANRVSVVAAVCGVLFACAAARGDDKPPPEKKHTVHFERAKWADVLDWYARITELKADVITQPEGAFTVKPGKDRQFTVAEITDLLNEALEQHRLLLIPNRKTFAVVSSKGKIDPKLIPTVELTDLPKFGKTALVEVTIPIMRDATEEIADELKKLLTPFGDLRATKDKSIVVRDTVGNIERIRQTLMPK
jgi:hypothetical protein